MIVYDRLEIEKRARRIRAAEFARIMSLLTGWLRCRCARLLQRGRLRRTHAAPRRP
jgi:hypothetical protein